MFWDYLLKHNRKEGVTFFYLIKGYSNINYQNFLNNFSLLTFYCLQMSNLSAATKLNGCDCTYIISTVFSFIMLGESCFYIM